MSDTFDELGDLEADGVGPLYLRLYRHIAEAIAGGRLQAGDTILPERELAARAGVSRVTVRRAIDELVRAGYLVQRRGSGTFVSAPIGRMEQALSVLSSFTEDMARRGQTAESRWISRSIATPSPDEIMALGLRSEDRISRLERVRSVEGMPLAIERASIPESLLPDPMAVEASLYDWLATAGNRPVSAVQRISAANVSRTDAPLLQIPEGAAVLRIERVSHLPSGKAVELTRSIYRGDAYDFAVELKWADSEERTQT
ncbi:GntR family transcriptional regulator [Paracoccus tegillarcae]|uniref:GntR family transcriptional regulator n=1 Tax=Paracoccus tegillarcae TaxID=1529068 RepID=A0A2K9EL52_9RHOB|nr:GntR family transcriptional regulator [Paracoccus tegillarcae]AUH32325.1 GntR family transcriptional regulator [Paracoccus tegillarcae]